MSKFKIPSIPATTNKSIRFPNDVIEQVEKAIVGKDCTFSAFVIEAVRMALKDLQDDEELAEKRKRREPLPFSHFCIFVFLPVPTCSSGTDTTDPSAADRRRR